MHYGLSGLVVRLAILRLEGLESGPLPNHTKDLKMGPNASLLGTHGLDGLGLNERMNAYIFVSCHSYATLNFL